MLYSQAVERLMRALSRPLPGTAAHNRLAPRPPREWPPGFNPAHIRNAAGLVLVVPIESRAHVVLTLRAGTLARHSGQVSLPGGVVDPGETFEHAALREAREEVSLDPSLVRVLGGLTPVDIPVSGFRLHPVLACAATRPSLQPADGEVARILEIPLEALAAAGAIRMRSLARDGVTVEIPYFSAGDVEIWGATAMVLGECLALVAPGPLPSAG